jgi:hypothetical protein
MYMVWSMDIHPKNAMDGNPSASRLITAIYYPTI